MLMLRNIRQKRRINLGKTVHRGFVNLIFKFDNFELIDRSSADTFRWFFSVEKHLKFPFFHVLER